MSADVAATVNKLTQTWSRGSNLLKKLKKSAGGDAEGNTGDVTFDNVRQALERHSAAVVEDYNKCLELYGQDFIKVFAEDKTLYIQLQDIRMDLFDLVAQISELEPEEFDVAQLPLKIAESQKISTGCIKIFENASKLLAPPDPLSASNVGQGSGKVDAANLLSRRDSSSTQASYSTTTSQLKIITENGSGSGSTPKEAPIADVSSQATQVDHGTVAKSSEGNLPDPQSSEIESSTSNNYPTEEQVKGLIKSNDDLLERRRLSRLEFYQSIRTSTITVEENSATAFDNDVVSPISPILKSPTEIKSHGPRSRSSSDYPAFVNVQRGPGQKRLSQASSILSTSTTSSDPKPSTSRPIGDIFRMPSTGGDSSYSGNLASTLRMPGFGEGVPDGMELVTPPATPDHSEKILDSRAHPDYHTPTSSVKSIDSPMRHDTSFYKFGGFCEGARASLRGELGYKIANRPTGTWSTEDYAKCIKCSYETSVLKIEKDARMDITGIYGSGESRIRWRQQFLAKSHVRTSGAEKPLYGCLFCIEDRKTPEEHDATIFFSTEQLFAHIARHQRPFPAVAGVTTLYGNIPVDTTNFDLHVMRSQPKPAKYNIVEIAPEVASKASASALTTFHPITPKSLSQVPDGRPALHFAAGARILGVSFLPYQGGTWCSGYHDGAMGSFPSAAIALDLPNREDVLMSPQSSLVAFAQWDFRPHKDAKEGWLKFSRGDKITHIGYTFQDQWCWSGQKDGKWGLFPSAFVEGLQDGNSLSNGSSKGGFFKKISKSGGSMSLGRSGRNGSVRSGSVSSGGDRSSTLIQPGLEVVHKRVAI